MDSDNMGSNCFNNNNNQENSFKNILKFSSPNSDSKKKKLFRDSGVSANSFQPSHFNGNSILNSTDTSSEISIFPQSQKKRIIQKQPYKVLDAPGLIDDFYVDLLDWSALNQIGVCLSDKVYTWSEDSGNAVKIAEVNEDKNISAIKFNPSGQQILLSCSSGDIQLWDIHQQQMIRQFGSQQNKRVGVLAFNNNQHLFAAGSKDRSILIQDIRQPTPSFIYREHLQEICGLSWSNNDYQLASGGNDNKVLVFNIQSGTIECKLKEHRAAVRALDWSPHQNGLLITGGGAKDQQICIWNTITQQLSNKIKVDSQVCKIKFSKNSNEFVSTHGYEDNEVVIWKYPQLTRAAVLQGHDQRVLYLALSPCGRIICSGSGDETLKFWNIFPDNFREQSSELTFNLNEIR